MIIWINRPPGSSLNFLDIGGGDVACVHRIHGYGANAARWYGTCHALELRDVELGGDGQSLEDAQESMRALVESKAKRIAEAVSQ